MSKYNNLQSVRVTSHRSIHRWTTPLMLAALAAVPPMNAKAKDVAVPATQPAAVARTQTEIMQDMNSAGKELSRVAPSSDALFDGQQRKVLASKMVPLLKRMLGDAQEFGKLSPDAQPQVARAESQLQMTLALLGDSQTLDGLNTTSHSTNSVAAKQAECTLLLVRWIQAGKDAALQSGVLSDIQKTAHANPTDENVFGLVAFVVQQEAATPALKAQALKILNEDVKNPRAAEVNQMVQGSATLSSLVGSPLTLAGNLIDGKPFTTTDWKGKVILVDFWASWCGPCRGELPRVADVYSQYHNKGLEVVGVSCDKSATDLQSFLTANKEVAWPQMYDAAHPGWNPLAAQFGIDSIPTMFLIDKKGIVRSVEARENFETLIPQLLAEK